MFSMRNVVEVLVTDDKDTALAFQEWALTNLMLSTGASSVFDGGIRYYFAHHHEEAIRAWFSSRADDQLGKKSA